MWFIANALIIYSSHRSLVCVHCRPIDDTLKDETPIAWGWELRGTTLVTVDELMDEDELIIEAPLTHPLNIEMHAELEDSDAFVRYIGCGCALSCVR